MHLKGLYHVVRLKEKPLTLICCHVLHSDRRVKLELFLSCVSDPFALRAGLAFDAVFNLWICGNREDFLSTDPLAPSVHNPVPFSHTALLTWTEASQNTAAVSVGAHTHAQSRLTHIPSPRAFVSQGIYCTVQPDHCFHNQWT